MNMNIEAEMNNMKKDAEIEELKAKLELEKVRMERAVAKGAEVNQELNIALKERDAALVNEAETLMELHAVMEKIRVLERNKRSIEKIIRLENKVMELRRKLQQEQEE